jgi:hypothetical protein
MEYVFMYGPNATECSVLVNKAITETIRSTVSMRFNTLVTSDTQFISHQYYRTVCLGSNTGTRLPSHSLITVLKAEHNPEI